MKIQIFSPHHIQLINACYPPSSALSTSGPDYNPNTQELSRLTYFASNRPGKLNKLGSELLKRIKNEGRKARSGNMRMRASLLITLSIMKALATECRRDISLLSVSLLASVDVTFCTLSTDLEIVARAASVFMAWTTFTDGHLIGADSNVTQNYLSALDRISKLSGFESSTADNEVRNRTRLIGLAALKGAITSEALYNDAAQFRTQVKYIMRPLLVTILQADISLLNEQATAVRDTTMSPYLVEFRARPAVERRAASIHVHIDGDSGPSMADVTSACLQALLSILEHSNGAQLGQIMRAAFDSLDQLDGWTKVQHCCWFARKTSDWSQYQYRYAVPTWLVERLMESQDSAVPTSVHSALVAMVTTVFNSPTPLINLSTSDVISNLIGLVLRRISLNPDDSLLPALVDCISALGRHVYYSDQIQDLGIELINRLMAVEAQGISVLRKSTSPQSRSQAIRCLIAGLLGMIRAANENEAAKVQLGNGQHHAQLGTSHKSSATPVLHSRRTKVPPDVWQDTLSILCDEDYSVRADYSNALMFYLENEMPKQGDRTDVDGVKRTRPASEGPRWQATNANMLLKGDVGTKFLNGVHAYLYILATTSFLDHTSTSDQTPESSPVQPHSGVSEKSSTRTTETQHSPANGRPSITVSTPPRSRKTSILQFLMDHTPHNVSNTASASASDYAHILAILTTVHRQLPVRGLLTGVPMLLALEAAVKSSDIEDPVTSQRIQAIKEIIARVWLVIGKTWDCPELLEITRDALSSMPAPSYLPSVAPLKIGVFNPPRTPVQLSVHSKTLCDPWAGVDPELASVAISSSKNAQKATGLDRQGLFRRLINNWTAESALKDSIERSSNFQALRGAGISPLLKLSPALMHIGNLSLHSLNRSAKSVGVTELREALEGRSSMSNPALAGPPSISTLEHPTSSGSEMPPSNPTPTWSRPKKRAIAPRPGEVRDVLNKLGIGKQTRTSLLKSSFPMQKSDQKAPPNKS